MVDLNCPFTIITPMNTTELVKLSQTKWTRSTTWWEKAASDAVKQGFYRLIDSPTDHTVYLARFWLTPPTLDPDGTFDSGDSVMLHYFGRPDHDRALHSHPWKGFRTTILSGGYCEELPPENWRVGSRLGPKANANPVWRVAGETIVHQPTDLHCVSALRPNTWTLMVTGPTVQRWHFHPEGEPIIDSEDYLLRPDVIDAIENAHKPKKATNVIRKRTHRRPDPRTRKARS